MQPGIKVKGKYGRLNQKILIGLQHFFSTPTLLRPVSRQRIVQIKRVAHQLFDFVKDFGHCDPELEPYVQFFIDGVRYELMRLQPDTAEVNNEKDGFRTHFLIPDLITDSDFNQNAWQAYYRHLEGWISFDLDFCRNYLLDKYIEQAFSGEWWRCRYADHLGLDMLIRLRLFAFKELYPMIMGAHLSSRGPINIISEEDELKRLIKDYLEGMGPNKKIQVLYPINYMGYTPTVSKATADRYGRAIIEILDARLTERTGKPFDFTEYEVEAMDLRMNLGIPADKLRSVFMKLCYGNPARGEKAILTETQVDILLSRCFQGFPTTTDHSLLPLNCPQGVLLRFIRSVKVRYSPSRYTKQDWIRLLQKNFEVFSGKTQQQIATKFAANPVNYPDHLII